MTILSSTWKCSGEHFAAVSRESHAVGNRFRADRLFLPHALTVLADVLPLLVHFQPLARQIAEVAVHVVRERFARFLDQP